MKYNDPTDVILKLVMKSPTNHFFISQRTDGCCYKTVYLNDEEPVSYDIHKLYK